MGGATELIGGREGEFAVHVASPHSNSVGAIIVLQEMFGVNAFMRRTVAALADQGYLAACPDLYWRQSPGEDLSDGNPSEIEHALALLEALDQEAALRDIADTCSYLRARIGAAGKIGAIGYCLGGTLAYLSVVRSLVDCGVSYYGSGIHNYLDQRDAIERPLLLHVPDRDRTAPADAADRIAETFANHPYVQVCVYEGLDHAFARTGTQYFRYVPDAADLANKRTAAFLSEQLAARNERYDRIHQS